MGRFYSVNEHAGNLLTCVFAGKHTKMANPLVRVDCWWNVDFATVEILNLYSRHCTGRQFSVRSASTRPWDARLPSTMRRGRGAGSLSSVKIAFLFPGQG